MSYPCQRDHTQAEDDVRAERARQDSKWGQQDHAPAVWIAVLSEEVGEAAREALDLTFGAAADGAATHQPPSPGALDRLRAELVQCAAVAQAAVEAIDRARLKAAGCR